MKPRQPARAQGAKSDGYRKDEEISPFTRPPGSGGACFFVPAIPPAYCPREKSPIRATKADADIGPHRQKSSKGDMYYGTQIVYLRVRHRRPSR